MRKACVLSAAFCFAASLFAGTDFVRCIAGGLLLLIVFAKDRKALMSGGSFKVWIFPMMFIVLSPFFWCGRHVFPAGIPYSLDQLEKGLLFLFHAYCFVVFASFIARAFSIQELIGAAERIGVPSIGLKVALGTASVKILSRMAGETYMTYRLARPGIPAFLRELHILFGAIMRNAALVAEQISIIFFIRNVRTGKRPPADSAVSERIAAIHEKLPGR